MRTLEDEKDLAIGTIVYCIEDCWDVSKMKEYKKGISYTLSHWFTDYTFGSTHSTQCTPKKYFSLTKPDLINNYNIY